MSTAHPSVAPLDPINQRNVFGPLASAASDIRDVVVTNPGVLFGVIVSLYLSQIAYYTFFHPYRKIPGPLLASFSKLWINIHQFRGTWHDDILAVHRQYGPVVRITPDEVSFIDNSMALKTLYGPRTGTNKSPWYNTWESTGPSTFGTQDVVLHKLMRGRVSSAYSMSSILAMEPFIQEVAEKCWARLRKAAAADEPVNLSEWSSYFTFDVVGTLAMGGDLGFLDRGADVDNIISAIHKGIGLTGNLGHVPFQMWSIQNAISKRLLRLIGPAELQAYPNFLNWLEGRVGERMKSGLGDRRKDMLQQFIEMKGLGPSGNQPATKEEVLKEATIILGAGADTTTFAIQGGLADLVMHPDVLSKLQREIDRAYQNLGLDDRGAEISYNDAAKLPYLAAVIKESMRLSPSFVYQMPRCTPNEGIQIGPYHLPAGLYAGISPQAMNRSKEIFGEDADEFVPERWLPSPSNDEESVKEKARLHTTFGMGSRVCIGQNIALVEVYKFIAQFVRHFELEVLDKEKPWTIRSATFAFRSDFWVRLKVRRGNDVQGTTIK